MLSGLVLNLLNSFAADCQLSLNLRGFTLTAHNGTSWIVTACAVNARETNGTKVYSFMMASVGPLRVELAEAMRMVDKRRQTAPEKKTSRQRAYATSEMAS